MAVSVLCLCLMSTVNEGGGVIETSTALDIASYL